MEDLDCCNVGTLDGLARVLNERSNELLVQKNWQTEAVQAGVYFCTACGREMRMGITIRYLPCCAILEPVGKFVSDTRKEIEVEMRTHFVLFMPLAPQLVPGLIELRCVNCRTVFTAVVYSSPDGPALAVLPSKHGGSTTPHTPSSVAYYLDQAARAQSSGANSAAVAMYRGALEQLLFEQGYTTPMCGRKLRELKTAIENNTAPPWAKELDTRFLQILKELGDGSIHPNDGDVSRQGVLDSELLRDLQVTFNMLLFLVYEAPHAKKQHLATLSKAAGTLKK